MFTKNRGRLHRGARLGLVKSVVAHFPEVRWQRCVAHRYGNVFSQMPREKVREVAAMLKAIRAQEDGAVAEAKARDVLAKLRKAAELFERGVVETQPAFCPVKTECSPLGLCRSGDGVGRERRGRRRLPVA